jgi:hypothetical protein
MRRSELLRVTVHCPHFNRPVLATKNAAISGDGGRLCDCQEKDVCRAPASREAGEHERPYPHGCPVFPSLAR